MKAKVFGAMPQMKLHGKSAMFLPMEKNGDQNLCLCPVNPTLSWKRREVRRVHNAREDTPRIGDEY